MNRELTDMEKEYLDLLAENGARGFRAYTLNGILSRLERDGLVLSIKNPDHTLYRITKKGMHVLRAVQS